MQEVKTAEQQLGIIQKIDELFIVAHETYIEFEEELSRITILGSSKLDRDFRTRDSENKIRINIRLLALLTAVKCYTDQTKRLISQLLPQNDEGARFWGNTIAELRDGDRDFRIMELVRNSAQHHALPVSYSKSNIKNDRSGNFPSQEVALGFFLSKSAVTAMQPQKARDKATKQELLAESYQRFDLVLLTRSYMQSICQLNNNLSNFTRKIFNRSYQVLDDLHKDMQVKLGIERVDPVVGESEYLYSSSGIEFLRSRHEQARKRYANKQMARLSYYPSDKDTYPSI
ncbi:hypothetical protein N6L27_09580 [Leisingera sp. SS27]|uniref:hypothetical protein n=1 Tax=Leisingera sp. SS27 TaxID=2979462 RepID=UPI00232D7CB6|nr:hypothetical protein [Leisingera sp. SS27]MDC0658245.1 hypothetical protein [Leisingera sp. SS27]